MTIFTNFTVAIALIFVTTFADVPAAPVAQDASITVTIGNTDTVSGSVGNAPILPHIEKV